MACEDIAGAVEALGHGRLAPPQRAPVAYPQRGPPDGECLCVVGFYVWLASRKSNYGPRACVAQAARCHSEAVPLLAPAGGRHAFGHMTSPSTWEFMYPGQPVVPSTLHGRMRACWAALQMPCFACLGVHRLLATPPRPAEARGLTSPGAWVWHVCVLYVCVHMGV